MPEGDGEGGGGDGEGGGGKGGGGEGKELAGGAFMRTLVQSCQPLAVSAWAAVHLITPALLGARVHNLMAPVISVVLV